MSFSLRAGLRLLAAALTLLLAIGSPAFAGDSSSPQPAADAPAVAASGHDDDGGKNRGRGHGRGRGRGKGRGWGNGQRGRWSDVVGFAANPAGEGYWVVTTAGQVTAMDGAPDLGSAAAGAEVIAITSHPTQEGYWLLDAAGSVSAHGAAVDHGSPGAGAVAIAGRRTGDGYWVAFADGRVAAFGDALHHGDARGDHVEVEGIVAREDADGYYLQTTRGPWLAFPRPQDPRDTARDGDRGNAEAREDRDDRERERRERQRRRERRERREREAARERAERRERRQRREQEQRDTTPTTTGGVRVTTVRGITVATSIADDVRRLMNHAEADGVRLGGWGYRSTAQQIELRRAHCGTTRYAIYEMPSSQCNPPTATPGSSMHEKGLAIDFYKRGPDGTAISIGGTGAFRWLERHAARYGLYNLPSEPWHWSTNGH